MTFEWPGEFKWPGAAGEAKVLNNMVVELLNVERPAAGTEQRFTNPREGWVFVSLRSEGEAALVMDTSDGEDVLCDGTKQGVQEAMRFLPEGQHIVRTRGEGAAAVAALIVRAIPELGLCVYPHPDEYCHAYGPKDEQFLRKNVFPNVNCIVSNGYGTRPSEPFLAKWRGSGRHWIARQGGTAGKDKDTPAKAYAFMVQDNGAFEDPRLNGFIVDEIVYEPYTGWVDAIGRLHGEYPEKFISAFTQTCVANEQGPALMRAVAETGGRIVWERYFCEFDSQPAARVVIADYLPEQMQRWRDVPGFDINRHFAVNLGLIFSAVPEMLSIDPAVDFKVHCDLQMCALANDPACRGLGGVMLYHILYAQDEHLDWAGKLFRHYCIEGKANLLSEEYGFRYRPGHITNPDFAEGTRGWTLAPAEADSIAIREVEGYGSLQGRYPGHGRYHELYPDDGIGDTFLWAKRTDKGPDTFSQQIRHLQPGKLYSLHMITSDYANLVPKRRNRRQFHRLSIDISGVDPIPERSFQTMIRNNPGRFPRNDDIWINLHRRVFRARAAFASLTISDWTSPVEMGGRRGREMAYNFVEIQPFVAE